MPPHLRDAAARGRSPEKTLAMWDRVLDGETRYIKGFKTTADFLLDTSFTYELGLISKLLGVVRRQFTLEGTTQSCGMRQPAALSMWHRWSWSCCRRTACCGNSTAAQRPQGTECRCVKLSCKFRPNAKKLFPNRYQTVKNAVRSLQTSGLCAIMEITSAHGPR